MKNLLIALFFIAAPLAANAETPQCTAKNVGIVQCMTQKLCECKYFRASEMAGTPERFGWDCGIERPTCGASDVNVTSTPAYNGPSSVGYGVSTTNTSLSNSPSSSQTQQQQSPTTTNTSTTTQTPTQTSTQTNH